MKLKILILFGLGLIACLSVKANKVTDRLFNDLDKAIENRPQYLAQKNEKILALKKILKEPGNQKFSIQDELFNELYNEYRSFNYDSAFVYSLHLLHNGYASKSQLLINKSKIKEGFILLSAGLFKETLDTLEKVNLKVLPDSLKLEYYSLLARTYFDMADFVADSYYAPLYSTSGKHMLDMAISICKDSSKEFLSLSGLKYLRSADVRHARMCYEKLIKFKDLDAHQFAIEASSLSFIYKRDKEPELEIQMLIKAAIADLTNSTKETVAIRKLAEIAYKQGNSDRAYNYVKVALDDAYFYGARHRKIQISDILPSIEDRQLEIVTHQRRTFLIYSLSVSVLSLLVILFIFIIFRQLRTLRKAKKYLSESNRKLSDFNRKLEEANLIKEEYIGHFFDTISQYINRLEKLKININRKLTTHQIEDVKEIIAGLDIKKEREQFYTNFDSIFLKIFPDFMKEFNSFMKEEKFISEAGQLLTPEIRIYALIRLGIADNDKIAHFLGYSLNTIYAYKTKIKNRLSLPSEEFDKKLMRIRTI